MASSARQIQKALAGKEDLLLGDGTVTQTRNGASYSITKLNADEIPYSGDAVSDDVVTIKAKIDESRVITDATKITADANAVSVAAYNIEWNQYIANDLEAAIALFGATEATLIITDEQTLTGNLTIPSNITLDIKQSGSITGAFTLTINGGLVAGLYQIFNSALTVEGNPHVSDFYPEWFGAVGDAVWTGSGTNTWTGTDDNVALQAVATFVSQCIYGGTIVLSRVYMTSDVVKIQGSGIGIVGRGNLGATFGGDNPPRNNSIGLVASEAIATGILLFEYTDETKSMLGNFVKDFGIYGNDRTYTVGYGIKINEASNFYAQNIKILGIDGIGFHVAGTIKSSFHSIHISNCGGAEGPSLYLTSVVVDEEVTAIVQGSSFVSIDIENDHSSGTIAAGLYINAGSKTNKFTNFVLENSSLASPTAPQVYCLGNRNIFTSFSLNRNMNTATVATGGATGSPEYKMRITGDGNQFTNIVFRAGLVGQYSFFCSGNDNSGDAIKIYEQDDFENSDGLEYGTIPIYISGSRNNFGTVSVYNGRQSTIAGVSNSISCLNITKVSPVSVFNGDDFAETDFDFTSLVIGGQHTSIGVLNYINYGAFGAAPALPAATFADIDFTSVNNVIGILNAKFSQEDRAVMVSDYKKLDLDPPETPSFQWTQSVAKPGEWYLEAYGGGDPGIAEPSKVWESQTTEMTHGTIGSLTVVLDVGAWDWGDNGGEVGFDTLYVKLAELTSPDAQAIGWVRSSIAWTANKASPVVDFGQRENAILGGYIKGGDVCDIAMDLTGGNVRATRIQNISFYNFSVIGIRVIDDADAIWIRIENNHFESIGTGIAGDYVIQFQRSAASNRFVYISKNSMYGVDVAATIICPNDATDAYQNAVITENTITDSTTLNYGTYTDGIDWLDGSSGNIIDNNAENNNGV